jgi:hypothetical protein
MWGVSVGLPGLAGFSISIADSWQDENNRKEKKAALEMTVILFIKTSLYLGEKYKHI